MSTPNVPRSAPKAPPSMREEKEAEIREWVRKTTAYAQHFVPTREAEDMLDVVVPLLNTLDAVRGVTAEETRREYDGLIANREERHRFELDHVNGELETLRGGPLPPDAGISDVLDVEASLRNVIEFAYEHGYHEHGVDLVREYRAALAKRHRAIFGSAPTPPA